jgi:hypothetical protein
LRQNPKSMPIDDYLMNLETVLHPTGYLEGALGKKREELKWRNIQQKYLRYSVTPSSRPQWVYIIVPVKGNCVNYHCEKL